MKRTLLSLLICFGTATIPALAQTAATEITASGSGSIALPPDMATVNATVDTNAENGDAAISQNNRIYDAVLAALAKVGVQRSDVTLSYYNVSYNPRPAGRAADPGERYGYTVSRSFAVKVREVAAAGRASDACIAAGATAINGVSFGLSDPGAARTQAIAKALAQARTSAEALARATSLRIVGVKRMDLGNADVTPVPLGAMARIAAPTQFDQSNVNVTASVTAVFLAEP